MKRIPLRNITDIAVDRMLRSVHPRHIASHLRQKQFFIPLIFFFLFFVFLLCYIDPAVIHSTNGINIHRHVLIMHSPDASLYSDLLHQPPFILELTRTYLHDITTTPGGWTRFVVTLLIYACGYPAAGALAIAALAFFFYWIYARYCSRIAGRTPLTLRFAPAFFIMAICTWYEPGFLALLLPVGGALTFATIYQRLHPAAPFTSAVSVTTLFWISWYLMQWGCLLLLPFILIHELFSDKRRIVTAGIAAAGNCALLYLIDSLIIPLDMAIRWSNFTALSLLPLAVISFFPLSALILAVIHRLQPPHTTRIPGKTGTIIDISFLICCTVAAGWWFIREPVHRNTRIVANTMHHIMNGTWERILDQQYPSLFKGFPETSGQLHIFMVHAMDHALERTGQIGNRLFEYPQATFSYDPLLMLRSMSVQSYVNWIAILELTMDLGMVSTAEKIAGDLMENMGPYPVILHRRALIQIAMGNHETAEVYLNKLTHLPFYRTRAKVLLKKLHSDTPPASSVPRVATMISNKDTVDYLQKNTLPCDTILQYLLRSNPGNKAAFDYLMTFNLLNKQFDQVAALASEASSFGYRNLPRYWEEARYLFHTFTAMHGAPVHVDTGAGSTVETQFKEFTKAMLKVEKGPDGAAKLAPLYGDSYFYYFIFSFSPGVSHE